jgi:hypothetical protein
LWQCFEVNEERAAPPGKKLGDPRGANEHGKLLPSGEMANLSFMLSVVKVFLGE